MQANDTLAEASGKRAGRAHINDRLLAIRPLANGTGALGQALENVRNDEARPLCPAMRSRAG
jgi:hypothetical protein